MRRFHKIEVKPRKKCKGNLKRKHRENNRLIASRVKNVHSRTISSFESINDHKLGGYRP